MTGDFWKWSDDMVAFVFGEHKLEPVRVWVEARSVKRKWWWGEKTVYYVCTQFMSQGPFSDKEDAQTTAYRLQYHMRQ